MSPHPAGLQPVEELGASLYAKLGSEADSDGSSSEERRAEGWRELRREALACALSAGTGELLTTVLFYPIELVKARLQAAVRCDAKGSFAYNNAFDGLLCIAREEGLRGLFSGLPSVAVRAIVADFAFVGIAEFFLGIHRLFASGPAGPLSAVALRIIGGGISVLFTNPLEVLSTRVTTARPPIKGATAIRQLYAEGGVRAFWQGLGVGLVLCLNPALMFTTVERFRDAALSLQRRAERRRRKAAGITEPMSAEHEQLSTMQALLVGFLAKFATMCVVYPLIRGKILLQARDTKGKGLLQVLAAAVEHEGLRTLYRGLGAQLAKSLLAASVKYAVKERTETHWRAAVGANVNGP